MLDGRTGAVHFRLNPEIVLEAARSYYLWALCIGAASRMSKLDKTLAERIRSEAKYWKSRVLAKRYGVSERTISLILNDRTYATG